MFDAMTEAKRKAKAPKKELWANTLLHAEAIVDLITKEAPGLKVTIKRDEWDCPYIQFTASRSLKRKGKRQSRAKK